MKKRNSYLKAVEIAKIRLRFIERRIRKKFLWAAIFLLFGVSIRTFVKWGLLLPYVGAFWVNPTLPNQNVQSILYMSVILTILSYILLSLSTLFLLIGAGRLLRIHYYMSIDSSRYFFLFSTFMFIIAIISWGYFFSILNTGTLEDIISAAFSVIKYGASGEMLLSAGLITLSINFIRHRKIIERSLKINTWIIYILVLLNILSIFEIALVIPFLLYVSLNKRLLHIFAYIDIPKQLAKSPES